MTPVIGIDPGKSGAICCMSFTAEILFPLRDAPAQEIVNVIRDYGGTVYLEQVRSSPQQGVVSAFTFGRGYGFLEGVVMGLGLPLIQVRPAEWQGALGCISGGDKGRLAAYARKLYPSVKITNDTADAVLIAHYGMMSQKYSRPST